MTSTYQGMAPVDSVLYWICMKLSRKLHDGLFVLFSPRPRAHHCATRQSHIGLSTEGNRTPDCTL
ncbi:uncharacterized protein LOC143223166 isoform X4 [Tachypleus tridentatus]|uniref:uncharacterized protein LOC143223166 isoform X4 n=1 Tax=Tachypleus tridentatus TaxID=6853 RepID=UPI003FCF574A